MINLSIQGEVVHQRFLPHAEMARERVKPRKQKALFIQLGYCLTQLWCVCVVQVYPTLWGQNVPTYMGIYEILVLVGSFFVPMRKTACK